LESLYNFNNLLRKNNNALRPFEEINKKGLFILFLAKFNILLKNVVYKFNIIIIIIKNCSKKYIF